MRATMPRVYLRIDPNLDQHPDSYLLLDLICAGARQVPRGRFKTWGHACKAVGQKAAKAAKDKGHLIQENGVGPWLIEGWDEWQEGDLTVSERVRRIRMKRYSAVTQPLQERSNAVPHPLLNRTSPSDTRDERRNGLNGGAVVDSTGGPPPPPDPIPGDRRARMIAEGYRLLTDLAKTTDDDPAVILAAVSERVCKFSAVSLAALHDHNLPRVLAALRADHERLCPPPPLSPEEEKWGKHA